jgi:hypothetical protein
MPRYSLNLRPIYDQADMVPWQQSLSQGIGNAISSYADRQARKRAEQNQAAAAGGVELPPEPQPSFMDRLHNVGSSISRVIHGEQTPPTATGPQKDGVVQTPVTPDAQMPVVPRVRTEGGYATPNRPSIFPQTTTAAINGPPPTRSTGSPAAPRSFAGQPTTIGSAIKPYTYHGEFGNYSIDPLYGARVQTEAHDMASHQHEEEQIAALVNAGMDPTMARAKVLNNVVRYDEQFGQQYRGRGGSALTYEQRVDLLNRNNAVRLQVARMAAAGRQNSSEYRQKALELREIEDQLRADENAARGYASEAAGVERTIPQGTNRVVEESQPGGKQRIESATERAARLRGTAADIRGKNAQRFKTGTEGAAADKYTPEQTRSRALQLKNQGYNKSAIYEMMKREGYNIAPPKAP